MYNCLALCAEVTSSNLTALVKAYVLGVSIDYPLPEPDACKGLVEGACPIEAGQQYVYNLLFALLDVFPSVRTTIIHTQSQKNVPY